MGTRDGDGGSEIVEHEEIPESPLRSWRRRLGSCFVALLALPFAGLLRLFLHILRTSHETV